MSISIIYSLQIQQANSMSHLLHFQDDGTFSSRLLFSLTADHFMLKQLQYLAEQTDLLHQISQSKSQKKLESCITLESQNSINFTTSQESVIIINSSAHLEQNSLSKTTIHAETKLRRMKEYDQILDEIERNCSSICYKRVKQIFEAQNVYNKTIRQLTDEIEANSFALSQILHLKEQNSKLQFQLDKNLQILQAIQFQREKLKNLQEKCLQKQNYILKKQRDFILKQKRLIEVKKKTQAVIDQACKNIEKLISQLSETYIGKFKDNQNNFLSANTSKDVMAVENVSKLWNNLQALLKNKIQQC